MTPILKYPRTPHLTGSNIQPGDEDLPTLDPGRVPLVIEEKLDGANAGISFDTAGNLILQSRGHILTGGPRERQFDLFKHWASHHAAWLRHTLGVRYVVYGEWLYARHTIAYDRLPHFFLEFDILDRHSGLFLDSGHRRALLDGGPVVSVPVIATAPLGDPARFIARSAFSSTEIMEGLYLKHEHHGHVAARFKFVRPSFLQAVADSGSHWMDRPIEPNRLRPGVDLF